MEKLDFILWMTLFPISQAIFNAITYQFCARREYSDSDY